MGWRGGGKGATTSHVEARTGRDGEAQAVKPQLPAIAALWL